MSGQAKCARKTQWYFKFENQVAHYIVFIPTVIIHNAATTHTAHTSMNIISTVLPGRLISCFADFTWPAHSTWSCNTRIIPLGLNQRPVIQNESCQYWWLKTANLSAYSRSTLKKKNTTCYNILPIATAGVYFTSRWTPTKCHTQTIIINTTSHKHGMYLSLLRKFFYVVLKCHFISKAICYFLFTL